MQAYSPTSPASFQSPQTPSLMLRRLGCPSPFIFVCLCPSAQVAAVPTCIDAGVACVMRRRIRQRRRLIRPHRRYVTAAACLSLTADFSWHAHASVPHVAVCSVTDKPKGLYVSIAGVLAHFTGKLSQRFTPCTQNNLSQAEHTALSNYRPLQCHQCASSLSSFFKSLVSSRSLWPCSHTN